MTKLDLSPATALLLKDTCVCLNLQKAARTVARLHDEALRPTGLTNSQFGVMMMLMRPEPPTITALAADLAMDRTSLTTLLKPLQRRGLIETSAGEHDRRLRFVDLTADGRRALRAALPLWQEVQHRIEKQRGAAVTSRVLAALRAYAA
jgi:DNA-binding MarR family transcriptional regulator